jgi:hypothetical protein
MERLGWGSLVGRKVSSKLLEPLVERPCRWDRGCQIGVSIAWVMRQRNSCIGKIESEAGLLERVRSLKLGWT